MLAMELVKSSFVLSRTVKAITYFSPLTVILATMILGAVYVYNKRRARLVKLIEMIPGPVGLPIIGNSLQINVDRDDMFNRFIAARRMYGRQQGMTRVWNGPVPYVLISKAQVVERILSSSVNINKGHDYDFLRPWLGDGLLTAPAAKWYHRRKALNPTLNYKMLSDFLAVFNKQATTMVRMMEKELNREEGFDCISYATQCSMDIVCETAMGCSINAQEQRESEYVKAHEEIGQIMLHRFRNIWLQPDVIFRFTRYYQRQNECLRILHSFSEQVIRNRRAQREAAPAEFEENNNASEIGQKRQLAFLDLLIETTQNGKPLSDRDIREEVDTFILGGHDTTATAIGWLMYLLGTSETVQNRLFEEIDAVMGQDRDREPTMIELNEMRYLDCCIKESLRLFPSIPLIARRLTEDVQVDKYVLPKGTNAVIVVYQLHRDPKVFPNPEIFNPDRFLPENCTGRHPYAFIPFSAGPRNCIGRKFAALEVKAVMVTILRKYRIESLDRREDLTLFAELVLRSRNGIRVRISQRG